MDLAEFRYAPHGKALKYFEQSLAISQGEEYLRRALDIAVEIGNKQIELNSLGTISLCYSRKGMYTKAIKALERTCTLAKELNNKKILATSYTNLGAIYAFQGNYTVALSYHLMSMRINEEQNNKCIS